MKKPVSRILVINDEKLVLRDLLMRVLGDIARLNAKRCPNKKALIMGEDSLTYGQLNQMANQLAHGLISKGVSSGDRIAVLAHNCLEAVVINYAVSKCGGIVVPANFRYKKDELVYPSMTVNPNCFFSDLIFAPWWKKRNRGFLALSVWWLSPGNLWSQKGR